MSTSPKRPPAISMQKVGGQSVRVAHWAGTPQSMRPPLLFFNGIGANLELALGLGDVLHDREMLTFDVPGIGESPPPSFPYRPWWLARLANTLCRRFGWDAHDVMGVSWGGAMAQQYAFQYRKTVRRIVLAATTTGVTMVPGNPSAIIKMRDAERYTDPNFMMENFEILYGDLPGTGDQHIAALRPPHPRGYLFQMLCMAGFSSLPFIRFIKQPALVLAGDNDTIVPLANAKILEWALPNPKLHVIEGGGHLFLVTRAAETMPVLRSFLDRADAPEYAA